MKKLLCLLSLSCVAFAQLPTDLAVTKGSGTVLNVAAGIYGIGNAAPYSIVAGTFTLYQATITSITSASQSIITLGTAWPSAGIHNGDTIFINGATGTGCSGLNALQTIVGLGDSTHLTINYNSTGCTYGASSATFGANPSATGTAYISGDTSGDIVLQHPASAGLVVNCATLACVINQVTTPDFMGGGVPLATASITSTSNGNWNTVTDKRRIMSDVACQAGAGITIGVAGGVCIVGIDTSLIPQLGAANTYTDVNDFSASTGFKMRSGSSDPATCVADKDLFINSTTHKLKLCTATNTWTTIGPP